MDVKSAFLYEKIEEEVYVCQPPGFEDPDFPDRVYKVEKALYGLHQAPRAWYETLSTYLLDNGFQRGKIDKTLFIKRHKGDILLMSSMGELTFFLGLQVKQKKDGIFISQDKYVDEILKKFGFTEVKTTSTPIETQKPLLKDEDGEEVDVHMYRSMIGSLMYLTSSRPDIMFAVCACARYQVNPKVSHLHAVKRIFRYLKGQPKLGLWYPKDSPFDLVAYTDSDYAGASLDRKSTTGGCQFLGCRLISWQCKKQTVVANSTTKAEYVAASSCCGQVLWIQNQLLDYGYNFMHTKIFIDNNRKANKSVRLMMEKLFGIELELILFWSTIMVKTINGEAWLHALVDGKKIIIIESSVRRDFQLADEEVSKSKTTAWNEFSSTMASAIIRLATNQKFNFSKFIFENTHGPQASDPIEIVIDEIYSNGQRSDDENLPPPLPPQNTHTTASYIVSTIKLPILKKGEYDIWAMKMEHYLSHTDYPILEVIQKGNGLKGPLAQFHKMTEAKEMWDAIKSRFKGLHKGYDRFQSLLSQLEIHGAGFSTKDANHKFLRVFEYDVKRLTGSSSSAQKFHFVSSESTSYGPQLDHEDLEQLDEFDLEGMDLELESKP
ncbi:putative ribonuclease H-like domain-containing protein [Tanacetum coccineum]